MTRLETLNIARIEAGNLVQALGVMNTPIKADDRLKADARYRLARESLRRAESDYQDELARTSNEELARLVG